MVTLTAPLMGYEQPPYITFVPLTVIAAPLAGAVVGHVGADRINTPPDVTT
jgi:hypothetical protein